MASANAPSSIASDFQAWDVLNQQRAIPATIDGRCRELEKAVLLATPQSNADAALMIEVLLAELIGERCDGADLAALRSIHDFLRHRG